MKTLALLLALALPLAATDIYVTTFEGEADPATYASFADSTDVACSGTESAKTTLASGQMSPADFTAVNQIYERFYVYLTDIPDADQLLGLHRNSTQSEVCRFEVTSTGTLRGRMFSGAFATSTETLSINTWYAIELRCDNVNNIAAIRLNTVVVASANDVDLTRQIERISQTEISDPTNATYYDDWAISDSAYPGYSAGCGDVSGGSPGKRKAMVVGD